MCLWVHAGGFREILGTGARPVVSLQQPSLLGLSGAPCSYLVSFGVMEVRRVGGVCGIMLG